MHIAVVYHRLIRIGVPPPPFFLVSFICAGERTECSNFPRCSFIAVACGML
jgi:hypothetical protein